MRASTSLPIGRRLLSSLALLLLAGTSSPAQWVKTGDLPVETIHTLAGLGDIVFAEAYGNGTDSSLKGIYRSVDTGATWTRVGSGLPHSATVYSPVSCGNRLFVGTDRDGAFVSRDSGTTWTPLMTQVNTQVGGNPRQLTGAQVVFLQPNMVFRSQDCGDHWTFLTPTWMAEALGESFAVLGNILLAGLSRHDGTGDLVISRDGGTTWNPAGPGWPSREHAQSLAVTNTHLLVGTLNHGLYRSSDLGASWTVPDKGMLSNANVSHLAVSGNHAFAAGMFTSVLYSGDNGATWQYLDFPPAMILSLTVAAGNVFVGTMEGEVWRRPLAEMPAGIRLRRAPSGPGFGADLPAIMGQGTRIDCVIPGPARVRIEVLDLRGAVVAVLADAMMAAGTHPVRLPLAGLPRGAYLLRLQADDARRIHRFMKMD